MVLIGLTGGVVAWSWFFGTFSALILAYFVCKVKVSEAFGKYSLSEKKKSNVSSELFSYSWPIIFTSIIASILFWIDSFSIGYFKDATQVGFYNAAVPIASLLLVAYSLFTQLFFPLITKEYSQKNLGLIKQLSQQIGKWIFLVNLPLLFMMMFFPGVFLNVLFGAQYLVAENALRYLAIGTFVYSIFLVSSDLLSMAGRSKLLLLNIFIAAVINAALNSFLVPRYGIDGASFATMICYLLLSLALMFWANRSLGIIPLRRKILRISLASAIPLAMLFAIRYYFSVNLATLIISGLLFVLLYAALIVATGCLDENDRMIIGAIKHKLSLSKE